MDCIIQAFTGVYRAKSAYTPSEVLTGIHTVLGTLPARAVIVGWHTDAALYRELIKEVHDRGKEIYIWLPVFSETSAIPGAIPAMDFLGEPHAGTGSGEEDFSFLCPSHRQNLDAVKRIYDEHFGTLGFDGVFLDKIRYSSFGNGFAPAMGCFCDACKRVYAENGVDTETLMLLLKQKDKPFFAPTALDRMRYVFDNPLVDRFFRVRAKIITDAVSELADWFHAEGLKVGLDVFAPVFAYLVGQDIGALARGADFIKPMIYRVTDAPAGLPYECRRMRDELRAHGCEIGHRIEDLWGVKDFCGEASLRAQLGRLKRTPCPVYVGLEVNYKPGVCETDEAYVTGSARLIADSGLGCVLSWDVLSDTKDHKRLSIEGEKRSQNYFGPRHSQQRKRRRCSRFHTWEKHLRLWFFV